MPNDLTQTFSRSVPRNIGKNKKEQKKGGVDLFDDDD